jgi:hypothetical protein
MISVQCDYCFQEYKVKPTLAGKRVKCKECGHAIRIPRPGEEEDPYAEDEFATGSAQNAPPPRRTDTRRSAGQATHKRKQASSAVSDSTLLLVLGGAGGGGLLLLVVVGIVFPLLGGLLSLLMIGLGGMVSGGAGIWIVVIAFQDDTLQGVLTLLVPFYLVYYAITRWDTSKFAFLTYVAGAAVGLCGLGLGAFLINKGVEAIKEAQQQLNADVGKPIDLGVRGDTVLGDFGGISDDSDSNTGPTETTDTLDVTAPKSDASKTPASVPASKPLPGPVNITRFWKLRDAKPVRAELVDRPTHRG